jgi:cobalt-zinc-cadmium efflux system protein
MAGEVVVGVIAGSLALLSDAAHMLTDAASIVLALVAIGLAARPPKGGYTYGLKRAEILSAQANGVTLLVLAGWLGYEAIRRLISPPPVAGGLVLGTALVGIAVNLAATWCLSKANRSSLNIEGAFQHILTDLFAFIATAVAGLVLVLTGFTRADAIATPGRRGAHAQSRLRPGPRLRPHLPGSRPRPHRPGQPRRPTRRPARCA